DGRAVVLIPLHHRAVLHPSPLGGHHIRDGAVADNHAAGVDAQVARLADQLFGELPDVRGGFSGTSGPGVHLACRVAERAGGIPQRTLTPVGDDVRDLGGVIPTVTAVDVLDDLLAAAGFDVKVDIRRAFT